ncbi:Alpha/Beta hydrolase protein [Colletotrichum navitas]|uniref:Alpha/Beta hydrolase protein n=1 Tax=Colletotrichum navitas TaxID=681940 RepID=A0AAD8V5U2_9PEZI|nr:Alpha/Beta hydrolase protein [Colletotrichum navitas]KAK1590493.1 Alpha/Beta hydrolase protein [Colletotrichum navitas]
MHFLKLTATAALLGQAVASIPVLDFVFNLIHQNAGDSVDSEAPYVRSYFYVGGGYVGDGSGGHIFRDQMYVEKLLPVLGVTQSTPIVLIHGQAQTGSNFLNKPDGGRGWASRFVEQGYEVYIVDQTFRGRSAWMPGYGASEPSTYSAEIIQQRFTAVQKYNIWPQAVSHTQWPGTGMMGDEVFDAFYSSNLQFVNNGTYQQKTVQDAGALLLDKIGKPVVLVGHSQGGLMPIIIADARPELTKALVLLEPTGPPFQEAIFSNKSSRAYGLTDIPVAYSPEVTDPTTDLVQQVYPAKGEHFVQCVLQAEEPVPRQLINLVDKPIILVTSEASYHAPYDHCTVQFLQQAGCSKAEHLELAEIGIHGNGHMFFMEKNSDQIQKVLRDWIQAL